MEDILRPVIILLSLSFCTLFSGVLNAGIVNLTVPGGPFYASNNSCQDAFGFQHYSNCSVTGYISSVAATSTTSFIQGTFNGPSPTGDFADAFNNWNSTQSQKWTLVQGTLSGSLAMGVSSFGVTAPTGAVGGISSVNLTYTYNPQSGDPTAGQLIWIQGLYVNYEPPSNPSTLQTTLDTYSFSRNGGPIPSGDFANPCVSMGATPPANNQTPLDFTSPATSGAYCDPIYPYQYSQKFFYDAPQGYYSPSGSFRGIALLGTATYVTNAADVITSRVLTVYDGFSYGFDNAASNTAPAPEPSTLFLLLGGVPFAAFAVRRRKR
jgi:hypothetical protein